MWEKKKRKKILIVDDEVGFTNILRLNVEETGKYEVMVENKGSQALNAARAFDPDLILLDIIMPDMQGTEVARQIKDEIEFKETPVVFLTAIVSVDEVDSHGGFIGGHPFLAKPVSTEQLTGYLDCFFGTSPAVP